MAAQHRVFRMPDAAVMIGEQTAARVERGFWLSLWIVAALLGATTMTAYVGLIA